MKQREITRRLMRIGVARCDAFVISSRITKQMHLTGPENTARYLKKVGDSLLYFLYGTGEKPTWVKTRHKFPVFIWEVKDYPEPVLLKLAKFARVVRLTVATKLQRSKVIEGATASFNGSMSATSEMNRLICLGISRLGLVPSGRPKASPIIIGRQFSRFMSVSGPYQNTSAPPLQESMAVIKAWPELTALPDWEEVFSPLSVKSARMLLDETESSTRLCGTIYAKQEGGAKLRMYAAPHTAIQCVMSPIHDWFKAYLEKLPMNCTWDQLRGAANAQARLKERVTVFSLDLSTATCRFPLWVQTSMARELGLPDVYIQAIESVSRGEWSVSDQLGADQRFLRWSVGQPLGMRFSMSMFSLAHNLLLAGIAAQVGENPWTAFNVLGDDVVIFSPLIAEVYAQVVQAAGVQISWHKSHASDRIAEFAGASITPDLVVRPGQFREVTLENVLELAVQHGILFHETSSMSQKVQKLYLFSKGQYEPESLEEYSTLLKVNSLGMEDILGIPHWKTKAPLWYWRIQKEFLRQFGSYKTKISFGIKGNASVKSVFKLLPDSTNLRFAKQMYEMNDFQSPFIWGLYWSWFGLWKDYSEQGTLSTDEFLHYVDVVQDHLRSLLYLPPRSKTEASKFKKLVKCFLPHWQEHQMAA